MTPKTPVYWRKSDGRKVVILKRYKDGDCKCYVVDDELTVILCAKELTTWVEPETIVRYHVLFNENDYGQVCVSCGVNTIKEALVHSLKTNGWGIIKTTQTGNDFTVERVR